MNIIELHGNIWRARCIQCLYVEENRNVPLGEIPPICKACGALLRPDVVWFNDNIPLPVTDACLISIEYSDVMLIVGTSGLVEPAASMGLVAKHIGKSGNILPRIVPDK